MKEEIEALKELGVEFCCNTVIGRTLTVEELFSEEGFSAVYIGTGAGLPRFMNIPGENLKGTFSANEFLTRINLMNAHLDSTDTPLLLPHKVAVIGGGNVAMDAARCAKRLGAEEVHIIYRRSKTELPARKEEIEHAEEEGIVFDFLTAPIRIEGDENGFVSGMTCVKMTLGEPDESGRRSPLVEPNSEYLLATDTVIFAIGTSPNPMIRDIT